MLFYYIINIGGCMYLLLVAAILPVAILCYYIYNKDPHKEPYYMLVRMFSRGLMTFLP